MQSWKDTQVLIWTSLEEQTCSVFLLLWWKQPTVQKRECGKLALFCWIQLVQWIVQTQSACASWNPHLEGTSHLGKVRLHKLSENSSLGNTVTLGKQQNSLSTVHYSRLHCIGLHHIISHNMTSHHTKTYMHACMQDRQMDGRTDKQRDKPDHTTPQNYIHYIWYYVMYMYKDWWWVVLGFSAVNRKHLSWAQDVWRSLNCSKEPPSLCLSFYHYSKQSLSPAKVPCQSV